MAFKKGEGGRKKGSLNKRTYEAEALAERLGVDPLEILLLFAKGDWESLGYENEFLFSEGPEGEIKPRLVITPEMRLNSAKEAVKYLYFQKKAVDHTSDGDAGIKVILEDYTKKD